MKNKYFRGILDVAWYAVVYLVIQAICMFVTHGITSMIIGKTFTEISINPLPVPVIISTVASSIISIIVFYKTKWAILTRTYLQTRPWGVLFWAAMLAFGAIIPMEWISEVINAQMPGVLEKLFNAIMGKPLGYLAIGICAPIAEEILFRGAILRRLLEIFDGKNYWWAIVISAFIFALIHGNKAQGINAFLMGLILGWLYFRTNSIIPGLIIHWLNNTVAYVMFNLMPGLADGKLIDMFHGSQKVMILGIIFSLMVFLPALLQLNIRAKKPK